MNDSLAGMVVEVRAGTESLTGSAGQIAAGSMALSVHADAQAGSLARAAGAMAPFGSCRAWC